MFLLMLGELAMVRMTESLYLLDYDNNQLLMFDDVLLESVP